MSITLRKSRYEELVRFSQMELQTHARKFINATPLARHQQNFADANTIYLSIERADGELAGYFTLVVEKKPDNIEFRRILIDERRTGVGQAAIIKMEAYCKKTLGATRVWLDVYGDNKKGMHIYEKLGYKRFKTEELDGRLLHFYEKSL